MGSATVRDFEQRDLDSVMELRTRVFGTGDRARERARWEWEYAANPAAGSAGAPGWVLERAGKIIGYYGLLPGRVAVNGRIAPAACGMDFCIDPDEQGFGLGLLFTRRFAASACRALPFVTSPTPAAIQLMKYSGAAALTAADEPFLWVLPAARVPAGGGPTSPLSEDLDIVELEGFDARFDRLFARLKESWKLLTVRDAAYLNWRYRDYPFGRPVLRGVLRRGELQGFCVVQREQALERAHLTELFVHPGDAAATRALVQAALAAAAAGPPGDLYALHREAGVQAALLAAGFHRVDDHPLALVAHLPAEAPELAAWYWTAGDGDLLFGVGGLQDAKADST